MTGIVPVTTGEQLRTAFGCFPSGVTAVCAEVDGTPVGLAASSFTSVSVKPALVSVCMQHSSTTWPVLRGQGRLGLSVLAEGHDDICARLARRTGDRFAGTDWVAEDGAVFVHGATLWLSCTIHAEVPAGDHDIVLLRVHGSAPTPTPHPSSSTAAGSGAWPSSEPGRDPAPHRRRGAGAPGHRRAVTGVLPLEGITVVALEQAVAGPLATRHLADLGARVIKIERPGEGDFARHYDHAVHGLASHFVWLNRGKESAAGRSRAWG